MGSPPQGAGLARLRVTGACCPGARLSILDPPPRRNSATPPGPPASHHPGALFQPPFPTLATVRPCRPSSRAALLGGLPPHPPWHCRPQEAPGLCAARQCRPAQPGPGRRSLSLSLIPQQRRPKPADLCTADRPLRRPQRRHRRLGSWSPDRPAALSPKMQGRSFCCFQ
jgi:hypothetical protein